MPAATALGDIHGNVGVAQQRLCIGAVFGVDGDSNTGADRHLVVTDYERLLESLHDVARDARRERCITGRWQDDTEFVTAQTRHGV